MSGLSRRDPHRRYPIVLTLLSRSAVDVLDEVVQLFDQAVSARESRARHKLADQLAERAKRGEDKLALAEEILPVLADPGPRRWPAWTPSCTPPSASWSRSRLAGRAGTGPLSAEDMPTEVAELKAELTALLPFAPIVSVLIELDRRTGFLDCFTHAGGATPRPRALKRNLLAAIIDDPVADRRLCSGRVGQSSVGGLQHPGEPRHAVAEDAVAVVHQEVLQGLRTGSRR